MKTGCLLTVKERALSTGNPHLISDDNDDYNDKNDNDIFKQIK